MAINLYDSYPICTISIPSGVVRIQRQIWKLNDTGRGIYIEMRDRYNNFIPFTNEGVKVQVLDASNNKHQLNTSYYKNGVRADFSSSILSSTGYIYIQIQITDSKGVKISSETFTAMVVNTNGEI